MASTTANSPERVHIEPLFPRPQEDDDDLPEPRGDEPSPRFEPGPSRPAEHIDHMLSDEHINMETYGVSDLRDGFFDALFLKPEPLLPKEAEEKGRECLPHAFNERHPLSAKGFLPRQWHDIKAAARKVSTTRAGTSLFKCFLAFFIAYVLCLMPAVGEWLGRYDYMMVVSVIINHPSRTLGAQVDGAIMTIVGTAAGLGWGALGLFLSTSTLAASAGYGGILTVFLAVFMASIAYIRAFFIRFYQAVLCAGLAVAFTTLAHTSGQGTDWSKIRAYAIPWLLGQAVALAVNCLVFPDAGNRPLTAVLDRSLRTLQEALVVPRPRDTRLRRRLGKAFMDMSVAYRDMRIELTLTRFKPEDVRHLRNLVQGTARALLSMETETVLFDDWDTGSPPVVVHVPGIDEPLPDGTETPGEDVEDEISRRVAKALSGPTKEILMCMMESLKRCHAALMDISGCRGHFGPPPEIPSDILAIEIDMNNALAAFDVAETTLLSSDLPESYSSSPQVIGQFVFARHAREAAATIVNLMTKVHEMQVGSNGIRLNLPTYPPRKAVYRTNAQVRHDRSGVTAGMYQATFAEIETLLDKLRVREGHAESRNGEVDTADKFSMTKSFVDRSIRGQPASRRDKLGYRIWMILHRLQGFESRYALKVAILTSALSIPAWVSGYSAWWNQYEAWWAVCMGFIMVHPRVGGNVQDLVTRALAAILGAVWAGTAFAAGHGNPYIVATFAAIYMIPMLYRFTQSTHPRSGLVGCLSFTVISLGLRTQSPASSAVLLATYKGIAFFVGTITPIIVNWILWPFVARHELRFALSSMLFFMATIYRNVVANYVYFDEGEDPTPEDIRRSEMLESRMREGFVRIRQLLVMTRHEIRLRAPFDPIPYSALAGSCERFFEYLIAVRQSALFYNPDYIRDSPVAAEKLLTYRRDAVAAILGNLYILAGALRSQRKVPRYLPSAAAARKKLILKGAEVAREMQENAECQELARQKTWSDIYSYSYNESLTGCVAQLEELEKFTKLIVGEKRFEGKIKQEEPDIDDDDDDDDDTPPNEKR